MDMPLSSRHFAVTLFLLFAQAITVYGGPSACLAVYQEGGAPAVFQSSKCPGWKLPGYDSLPCPSAAGTRCQVSTFQGRRRYQEDRTFCALDVRIPFPTCTGPRNVTVGIAAVFDGHGGAEASEMASKLLFDYFMLHTHFLRDTTVSLISPGKLGNKGGLDAGFQVDDCCAEMIWQKLDQERVRPPGMISFDRSYHFDVLKDALVRAIEDIDAEFSEEALRRNYVSGSTANVILMADGKILAANVGDSKALLCSEKLQSPADAKVPSPSLYSQKSEESPKLASSNSFRRLYVQELTSDHKPDRYDERSRVQASGGFVLTFYGVPRVNGQLAVSRAIGDLAFKSYGVTATPEVTDWRSLGVNDTYLVVASDGIFEGMSPQVVCDILSENSGSGIPLSGSLADRIVKGAFEKGSWDNLSAVVVPLQSIHVPDNVQEDSCTKPAEDRITEQ